MTSVREWTAALEKLTVENDFICSAGIVRLLADIYDAHTKAGDDVELREEIVEALNSEGGADVIVRIISSLSERDPTTTSLECHHKCYCILWDFSDTRGEFIKNLMNTEIVRYCVENLKNEERILSQKKGKDIIKGSLGIIYNVSREEDARDRLGEHDWTCLNPYKEGDNEYLKAMSAMILAFLSDAETEGILGEKETTQYIVKLLREAKKDENHRKQGFTCTELIEGLARLAINDDNKRTAQESDGVSLLMEFIKSSDQSEQEAAAKCLYTLAFDPSVKADLEKYREELEAIRSRSSSEALNENMRGLLMTLKSEGIVSQGDSRQTTKEHDGHIMISYSWCGDYGPETARRIANYLENRGFKVWIDVERMNGAINDAMVDALNNAKIFILCVSDGYRRSNNCRLEAIYAHNFKTAMIPVIIEFKKSPKGDWLSLIQADLKYIDFSEGTNFNDKCKELIREVRCYMEDSPLPGSDEADSVARPTGPSDVKKWLQDNDLDSFTEIFRGVDTSLFPALQSLKREAPEFFYRCLWEADDDTKIKKFINILKLTKAMENL